MNKCLPLCSNGWTPLHSAASSGNIDAVVMLINAPNVECNLYTKDDTSVMRYCMFCFLVGPEIDSRNLLFVNFSYMVRIREDPSEPDKLWKVMNKMVDDLGAEIDHPDKFGEVISARVPFLLCNLTNYRIQGAASYISHARERQNSRVAVREGC